MKIQERSNASASVEVNGKTVRIHYERESGKMPEVISARYRNDETDERVSVEYNVAAKKIGNYSVSNPTQSPAKAATLISAIKTEFEEIVLELEKSLTNEK